MKRQSFVSAAVPGKVGRLAVLLVVTLLLPGVFSACAATTQNNPFESGTTANQIQITVENRSFNNATITARWEGGVRTRLGSVPGTNTRTFTTPWRSDVVQFEIDFLAGNDYTTRQIYVSPGEQLDLRLRP